MLGYKSSPSVKPSYNGYRDADPDNAGDQLVDFSKRYPENDSEEVCRPPSVKNPKLSLTSMYSEENKQPGDELKIYCMEGTPQMASSASSYSDLRDVGIIEQSAEALISKKQTRKENCFSSGHNFSIATPDSPKSCLNSNLIVDEIPTFDQAGVSNKDEECGHHETEATFTKSSSPLMFSRSSSVGSLNSYEQTSIVDDRSSVSAFSNLASGMISPSEIPDSPCEVTSPFISKSKNNEFQFPSIHESGDLVLSGQTVPGGDFSDEAFEDFQEDDIKVFNDEGDCNSVSNLSALSIQANSTHVAIFGVESKNALVSLTLKSSVAIKSPITNDEADFVEKCQNLQISDEPVILEQNCLYAKPSLLLDVNDINQSEKTQNIIEAKYENKGTSTSEDYDFCHRGYERSLSPFDDKTFRDISKERYEQSPIKNVMKRFKKSILIETNTLLILEQSSDYSKDNSDDESDALLEECILSGMPSKDNSIFDVSKESLNHSFQTSGSSLKDEPNCSLSDNEISDDDEDEDGILKECVLLGMPHKSNNSLNETEKSCTPEVSSCSDVNISELPVSKSPNRQSKLFDDTYQSAMLSLEKQINQVSGKENFNRILPESERNFAKEENFSSFNLFSPSEDQDSMKKDLAKSDDDSDIDECELLVQQCIQLGKPKTQLTHPKSLQKTNLPVIFPPDKALGYRDNCPDGISDGDDDDDDDILKEIIKAGRPDSDSETNKPLKSQNQRLCPAAEDRALFVNNYCAEPVSNIRTSSVAANALIVDDSTYIYRTEDTPILSPTASLSDLSTLSFTEDKVCQESFLNNSRNSDCSSESEDDELLLQCIRQGMPGARRVAA